MKKNILRKLVPPVLAAALLLTGSAAVRTEGSESPGNPFAGLPAEENISGAEQENEGAADLPELPPGAANGEAAGSTYGEAAGKTHGETNGDTDGKTHGDTNGDPAGKNTAETNGNGNENETETESASSVPEEELPSDDDPDTSAVNAPAPPPGSFSIDPVTEEAEKEAEADTDTNADAYSNADARNKPEPTSDPGTGSDSAPAETSRSSGKKTALSAPALKASAVYYYWFRLDLNGGSITAQTRYPQFYTASDGHTVCCRTLASVDKGKNFLAFIGSGENAGKSYCFWDSAFYNSDRLYLPSVTGTTNTKLNPGLNASRTGYHISVSKAYNTAPDGSGTSFCSRDYKASAYATLERLTGSSSLNLNADRTGTLYVNWLPNRYTVTVRVKKGSALVTDAGADFRLSEYSASSGSYGTWASSPSLTDNGDGTYSLQVRYTEDNQGRFRIRMNSLSGDYSYTDTETRYLNVSDLGDGDEAATDSSGNALDWTVSSSSYRIILDANGGMVYGSSVTSVPARTAGTGSRNLRFGRTYSIFNAQSYESADITALSAPLFTRDGYLFGGWANAADPSEATVFLPSVPAVPGAEPLTASKANSFDEAVFGITPASSDSERMIRLYAQWVPRIHRQTDTGTSNGRLIYDDEFAQSRYSELTYYIPDKMENGSVQVSVSADSDFTWQNGHFYYNNELSSETDVPGSLTLTLTDRAFDKYGHFYDCVITLSSIRLNPDYNGRSRTLAAGTQYIFFCDDADGTGRCTAGASLSASYHIRVSLFAKDGSPAPSGKTLMYFSDLDQPDKTTGRPWKYYESGTVSEYAEAITVPLSSSSVFYTTAGENSIFAENTADATRITGGEATGSNAFDNGTITNASVGGKPAEHNGLLLSGAPATMSAIAFIADTDHLEFSCSGPSCTTNLFSSPSAEIIPVTGSVTVHKRSSRNPEIGVEGAVLAVMRFNGSSWEPYGDSVKTDAAGEASFTLLYSPLNDLQNRYYIYETKGGAPAGYRDSDTKLYFKIDKNGTVTGFSPDSFDEISAENTIYDEPDEIALTITKDLDASDLYEAHGSPNFAFEIIGEDRTFHTLIDFTGAAETTGTISRSKTIHIPAGAYTIRELLSDRYVLTGITPGTSELAVTISDDGPPQNGIQPVSGYAYGTLTSDAQVTFTNRKTRWENYSHTSSVINHFS